MNKTFEAVDFLGTILSLKLSFSQESVMPFLIYFFQFNSSMSCLHSLTNHLKANISQDSFFSFLFILIILPGEISSTCRVSKSLGMLMLLNLYLHLISLSGAVNLSNCLLTSSFAIAKLAYKNMNASSSLHFPGSLTTLPSPAE